MTIPFLHSPTYEQSPSIGMTSPNRRSTADLQRLLDGLIGDQGSIRCGDLPDVLIKYEIEHDAVILEPSEYDGLRQLCLQSPDIELESKDIFTFLSIIPKVHSKQSSLSHSVSMPLAPLAQSTPPVPTKQHRRHSDRVRSPSDSSGSESDEAASSEHAAPPPRILASGIPRLVARHKGSSTAPETPPPARTHAPSSFSPFGAFARPSPMNRRRRGSLRSPTPEAEEEPPSFTRNISASSIGRTSPPWSGSQKSASSPTAGSFDIEKRSYHRGMTPDHATQEDEDAADRSLQVGQMSDAEADEVYDQVEEDIKRVNDSLNPRLSRISTESSTSLRTSHDKLQVLQKHNTELIRKLKEAEKQLAVLGSENERLVEDLQEKLEETRAEIAQRRKDEKELKSKDRAQLIQISGFEGDIQSLQRSLENAKKNHANMQSMYNGQCDETQRLRDLLKERDEEIERLEDASIAHEGEESKFNREVEALETQVKRLEQDLSIARQAESHLETQKQENLQLKETIDRMRFELDEARSNNAASGHSRGVTGSSGAPTLSRNLGAEISRRLEESQEVSEEEEDSYVETVVTTQKTRKIGNRSQRATTAITGTPAIRFEEQVREYADVGTSTETSDSIDTVAGSSQPPAYTAEPLPLNAQQILDKAHPRGAVQGMGRGYDGVVQTTGVRCTILEDELKLHGTKNPLPSLPITGHDRIVGYVYLDPDTLRKYGSYVVAAFTVGLIIGSSLFGVSSRDVALFHRMNTLALASGAGEGFLPFGHRGVVGFVEHGAKMVAGRVPS